MMDKQSKINKMKYDNEYIKDIIAGYYFAVPFAFIFHEDKYTKNMPISVRYWATLLKCTE